MLARLLSAVCLFCLFNVGFAGAAEVQGMRLWAAPDNTRVVFDLSGPVEHSLFSLSGPDRVVIDLDAARLAGGFEQAAMPSGLVGRFRHGERDGDGLRLVLDLKSRVRPKSFVLKPNDEYGYRLVVDLYDAASSSGESAPVVTKVAAEAAAKARPRELIVAIDAGHGGEDPGARGKHGTREKDVVLQIARALRDEINRDPYMKAVMIRDGDYFLSLRKRMDKARAAKADLFVSIHADAFHDRSVRGSSVYILSERGASSEMARILAEQENAADLVGGVSLGDKDPLLQSVLVDLSQAASLEASSAIADNMLAQLKRVGKVHKRDVQQAGFMVLKSPDVPSILVETAFISNPSEERQLRDRNHQKKMAKSLMQGIKTYFERNPPPGTLLAQKRPPPPREHIVRSGDTLSEIAQRYQVRLSSLRSTNGLTSDRLRVGDTLRIPTARGS